MKHSKAPEARRRLVIASANPGKLREFRALLADLPFDLVGLPSLGVASPAETGESFAANALLKAHHAAAASGAAAIADDSGLEVDALGGAPGIRSARYAGECASDAENNAKLIAALEGIPFEARRARYRCALAYVDAPSDPAPLQALGVWEGYILAGPRKAGPRKAAPRGSGGFGYDPYFWLPELGVTAAELDVAEKNRLSHRGAALRSLRDQLAGRLLR